MATVDVDKSGSRLLVSKGWVQVCALVLLFGFTVMGILAFRTYTDSMPLPERVVDQSGQVLFTGDEITAGQEIFLERGLMQYGSVLGHGGYLGPDYTADYLRRAAADVLDQHTEAGVQDPSGATIEDFRTNGYDAESGDLVLSGAQSTAFVGLEDHYATVFGEDSTKYGLLPNLITDRQEIHEVTAFFAWTAWAAAAERPGKTYSYTNNWPPESLVDNRPTGAVVVWSVLSLVALLGGTGLLFAVYGRWSRTIGWHGTESPSLSFRQPGDVVLTPSQRATAWFFLVIALLFVGQTLVGAAAEHYRADILNFFGFDLAQLLPFNLARTWHVQLSLFWTAAAFLAAGIFLTPFIARREPRGQHVLAYVLLGAVAVVVFGSLISEALSIHGVSWAKDSPIFSQQWEYLDLPRLWQILLVIGLFVWIAIIYRGLGQRLRGSRRATCRGCSSTRPWPFRASTRSDFWRVTRPTSRWPSSGGSGSSICGWRTSSSCSPR